MLGRVPHCFDPTMNRNQAASRSANLKDLDQAGLRFIVGSRAVKGPKDLESRFRWHGDVFTDGQLIDTLTPRTGHKSEKDPKIKTEPV
jgi:hypothetical protein